jgi:hypothetical protein
MQQTIGTLGFLVFSPKLSRIAIAGNAFECFQMLRRIRILERLGIPKTLERLGIRGRLRMLGVLGRLEIL